MRSANLLILRGICSHSAIHFVLSSQLVRGYANANANANAKCRVADPTERTTSAPLGSPEYLLFKEHAEIDRLHDCMTRLIQAI